MVNNATDSYAIGEVFDGDAGYACEYQSNGLDAFLNFPIYYTVTLHISLCQSHFLVDGWRVLLQRVNTNARIPSTSDSHPRSLSRSHSPGNIQRMS